MLTIQTMLPLVKFLILLMAGVALVGVMLGKSKREWKDKGVWVI